MVFGNGERSRVTTSRFLEGVVTNLNSFDILDKSIELLGIGAGEIINNIDTTKLVIGESYIAYSTSTTPSCCGSYSMELNYKFLKKDHADKLSAVFNLIVLNKRYADNRNQMITFSKRSTAHMRKLLGEDYKCVKAVRVEGAGTIYYTDLSKIRDSREVIIGKLRGLCRNAN